MVSTLSESRSRAIAATAGVPVSPYVTAPDVESLMSEASGLDRPLVLKLCGDRIAHKTERGLVRLRIADEGALRDAAEQLLGAATADDGEVELLASPMIDGNRELIAGLVRDEQFGPCVMLGIGGVLAEAIGDVAFRLAPLSRADAHDLLADLDTQALFEAFRGEPAIDREAVVDVLVALSDLAADDEIDSVDLNPLIVVDGRPVAVDALVVRRD